MPTLNLKSTHKAVGTCYYSLVLSINHETVAVYAARIELSNQQNKCV